MQDKLRIVFVPFVLALAGLTAGYPFLNWLLIVKLGVFQPKENLTEIVLPLLLAGATGYFYIAPKVKVLDLKTDFFHTFLAFIGLAIPMVFAQKYMAANTGKQTILSSIEEIANHAPTKYYALGSYRIDTATIRYHATYSIEGRNADRFKMYLYAVMPIRDTDADTLSHKPTAWLGTVYEDEISSRKSHETLERAYNAFIRQSQARTGYEDFSHFLCFERIGKSSKHYEGFWNAVGQGVRSPSDPVILEGMNVPYGARDSDLLQRFLTALLIALGGWLLLSIIPKTNPKELKRIKERKPDLMAQIERQEWLDLIIPHKGWFVTPIIMLANTAVFFLMVFAGKGFLTFQADDLLAWGGCYAPMVSRGEWWRLLTAPFLHDGVMHLFANMACLVYVGKCLEPLMNRTRYICIYLLSALAGSVASLLWHTEPIIAVGASGAIFGFYGAYIALLIGGIHPKNQTKFVLKETATFIGINLVAGIVPGIDNAAHIGGLLCGLLLGFAFLASCKRTTREKPHNRH